MSRYHQQYKEIENISLSKLMFFVQLIHAEDEYISQEEKKLLKKLKKFKRGK